jgi:hypothetical protein
MFPVEHFYPLENIRQWWIARQSCTLTLRHGVLILAWLVSGHGLYNDITSGLEKVTKISK